MESEQRIFPGEVPFCSNLPDNTHCYQAALRMVLGYYEPGEVEYDWDTLDEITGKAPGLWTWVEIGIPKLLDMGFDVKMISSFDYRRFIKKGYDYWVERNGTEVASIQLTHANMGKLIEASSIIIDVLNPEHRVAKFDDLNDVLDEGFLPVINVNHRSLYGMLGYSGHFVVPYHLNEKDIFFHDPGLPPRKEVQMSKDNFLRGWAYPGDSNKSLLALRKTK